MNKKEKTHWRFAIIFILSCIVVFVILAWHKEMPILYISFSGFGSMIQGSITAASLFIFTLSIVLWRLDQYKDHKSTQEEILNDFRRYMPRYTMFLALLLIMLIISGFFDPNTDKSESVFRYFSLGSVAVIICGFFYLFKSSLSYINNFKGPEEKIEKGSKDDTINSENHELEFKSNDFSLSLKGSKENKNST